MPKKNAAPDPEVEKPVEKVENPPEQTEPIEPDANQPEPEANQGEPEATPLSPDELIAAFVRSPEFSDTMRIINEKLDKINTIIRGIINRNDPPAEEKPVQHVRKYL